MNTKSKIIVDDIEKLRRENPELNIISNVFDWSANLERAFINGNIPFHTLTEQEWIMQNTVRRGPNQ